MSGFLKGKGREGGPEKDCFPMQSLMFPQPEQSHHQLRTSRYMGENDFRDEALVTGAGEEQQVFLHFYFTKQKCVNREREKTKASCVFKEEQSSFANYRGELEVKERPENIIYQQNLGRLRIGVRHIKPILKLTNYFWIHERAKKNYSHLLSGIFVESFTCGLIGF